MITCLQLEQPNIIQQIREDYLHTLIAPMDGMWESAVIQHATFWEIQDQEQQGGHFCIDSNNCLLRFHLLESYQAQAQEIFRWILSTHHIQYAIAGTIEPLYFSLCLGFQKSCKLHTYLFQDNIQIKPALRPTNIVFTKAEKSEFAAISRFYHANTEGSGEWIEAFLHKRLNQGELFVLYDQQTLVATGECIPSPKQLPYADLGMVVARSYRGKGLGSSMLIQLKQHCYAVGWKPICSCAADNHASRKAIEKAGFISEHSMVKILL